MTKLTYNVDSDTFIMSNVDGDTFIMSANNGRILLTKNDKSSITFSIEQARKIGAALALAALQDQSK
jgi:hypothetical protein